MLKVPLFQMKMLSDYFFGPSVVEFRQLLTYKLTKSDKKVENNIFTVKKQHTSSKTANSGILHNSNI